MLHRHLRAIPPGCEITVSQRVNDELTVRFELDLNTMCKLKAQSVGNTVTIAEECERDLRPKRHRRG